MQNSIYRLLIIIIIIFGFYCVDAYVQDLSYFRSATRNNLKIFYGTDITGEEEGGWRARVRWNRLRTRFATRNYYGVWVRTSQSGSCAQEWELREAWNRNWNYLKSTDRVPRGKSVCNCDVPDPRSFFAALPKALGGARLRVCVCVISYREQARVSRPQNKKRAIWMIARRARLYVRAILEPESTSVRFLLGTLRFINRRYFISTLLSKWS